MNATDTDIIQAYAEIPLNLGGGVALVDQEDYDRTMASGRWRWWRHRFNAYAIQSVKVSPGNWTNIKLHRFILNPPPGATVMHMNGNGLDCRKINLRIGTPSLNGMSHRTKVGKSSIYRGVHYRKNKGLYEVRISINRCTKWIGQFKDEKVAAEAYNKAALLHFGEFASLNQI